MGDVGSRTTLNAMAGVGGWKILTDADSPYSIDSLVIGARTTDSGVLVSGKQISDNTEVDSPFTDVELNSSGQFDPLWSRETVITVPTDATVKVFLGD